MIVVKQLCYFIIQESDAHSTMTSPEQQPFQPHDPNAPLTQPIPRAYDWRYATQQPVPPFYQAAPARNIAPAGRKRSKAGLLTVGALAVAVAGGGIGATAAWVAHPDSLTPPPAVASPAPHAAASQPAAAAPAGSVEQVAAKVMPSVVKLRIQMGQGEAEGSGVVLTSDGLILTNNHVAAAGADSADGAQPASMNGGEATRTVTFSDGRSVPFSVVGTDPTGDLAVVRAEGVSGLTPIAIGSSKDVKVGEQVVAIGSPLACRAPSPPASSARSTARWRPATAPAVRRPSWTPSRRMRRSTRVTPAVRW